MTTTYNVLQDEQRLVKAWTKGVELDDKARQQLMNVASLPFIHKWVAAMPDAHWGMGATIGSVIATKGAIIPAAVGVDLGCGMVASRTSLKASDLPDNLHELRSAIEAAVPHGRTENGRGNDKGGWGNRVPEPVLQEWQKLDDGLKRIEAVHPAIHGANSLSHLGTLGTGNHFIEICLDKEQHVWIMLHSGSRGIGNRIGSYFIEKAKQDMRRWFINLPDEDLAYIPEGSEYFKEYYDAVKWAQEFAFVNRQIMLRAVYVALEGMLGRAVREAESAVNCHHNYIAKENHYGSNVWVTRKGAVRARKGDLGIIPGSMGAKSFIVRGLGNPESFESCSHGAGRTMSRAEAKRRVTLEAHAKAVEGVECRIDADVVDETPAAYKSIDAVMEAQKDLVEVVYELKQVLCVKG
jgi:tRNA-splicing ligase RtcB